MKMFGPPWGHDGEVVPTPVGEKCLWCEEPVVEGDRGVVTPFMDTDGQREAAQHRECLLRSIFGSVGHQLKRCSCFGGTEEDPPGATRREAAKAAVALFDKMG